MIHIKKPNAPEFLADPAKKWVKETERAKAHYAGPDHKKAFEFEAYRDEALKAELKKVFKKCAYCESSYEAVYDGDIEHFRPKGKVSEKHPQVPGYYWLANDWDNLLLSCQHCNQRRNHVIDGETAPTAAGKLDQFPLSDESLRVSSPDELIAKEEAARLLLNPCIDNPEAHFEYESTEGVMIPKTKQGESSLAVYALTRPNLVQARKEKLIILFMQIRRVGRELDRFRESGSATDKTIFEEEFDALMSFVKAESQYAGMCRFFVRQFLKANNLPETWAEVNS